MLDWLFSNTKKSKYRLSPTGGGTYYLQEYDTDINMYLTVKVVRSVKEGDVAIEQLESGSLYSDKYYV